jgi:Xaa-Pro dipeptidase
MKRRTFLRTTAATAALAPLAATSLTAQPAQGRIPKATVDAVKARILPITAGERQERIERARSLMTEQHIDALFMEGGVTLTYFTGVNWGRSERLFAWILPCKGEPAYIAPKFEEARARELTGDAPVFTWEEHESPYTVVRRILEERGAGSGTMGIEETTRAFVTERLARETSATLTSGTPVTAGCRAVKSAHEVELIQIANDILREVYTAAVPLLREGMKEPEFAAIVSSLFREFGVGGGALVLFGEASAYPHGTVKEHSLQQGDIVLIDGGCSVQGYASDVTRTVCFGSPTPKMTAVFEIVRAAQSAALTAARPGAAGEAIDAAARGVVVAGGYGPDYRYFTHRLGHGIGMEGHEWYYLVRGNTRLEVPGDIHSNEPGIYIPGEFGIRLEDEMLITADGAKLLLPQAPSLATMF